MPLPKDFNGLWSRGLRWTSSCLCLFARWYLSRGRLSVHVVEDVFVSQIFFLNNFSIKILLVFRLSSICMRKRFFPETGESQQKFFKKFEFFFIIDPWTCDEEKISLLHTSTQKHNVLIKQKNLHIYSKYSQ